jgi:hypothetical protein
MQLELVGDALSERLIGDRVPDTLDTRRRWPSWAGHGTFEWLPSIHELARAVGVNDLKLKQSFPQLFGTTVFGYLDTPTEGRRQALDSGSRQ